MAGSARRIPHQRAAAALRKANAGESLTPRERQAIDNLTSRLGLNRPLDDYAPRTQRRYLKVAREGSRARQIETLRARLAASTIETRDAHSADAIQDLVNTYGERFVYELLAGQVRAMEQYAAGSTSAGAARWATRSEFLQRYRRDVYELDDVIDPYFYYHGSLSN
jgi:aspartokinase